MPSTSLQAPHDIARTLAESDAADRWHAYVLAAWKDGYHAGATGEYERGYQAAITDVKAADHALYDHLRGQREIEERRWTVHGERRTRETYGQLHPCDRRPRRPA